MNKGGVQFVYLTYIEYIQTPVKYIQPENSLSIPDNRCLEPGYRKMGFDLVSPQTESEKGLPQGE